jgi:hypothetical protein
LERYLCMLELNRRRIFSWIFFLHIKLEVKRDQEEGEDYTSVGGDRERN